MAKRIITKQGDIFEVPLENNKKGYFQYILVDTTQLSSSVIRVFKKHYSKEETVDLEDVVKEEVSFYAHAILKVGIKMNLWQKVGNMQVEEDIEAPYFRCSADYGNPEIKISNDWYIWKVNEKFEDVDKLNETQKKYDIGVVIAATEIPERMNTGKYSYFYPASE